MTALTVRRLPPLVALLLAAAARAADAPPAEPLAPPQPAAADTLPADAAYALGHQIGGQIVEDHERMGLDLDRAALARGLTDAVTGAKPALEPQAFQRALAALEAAMARRQQAFAERMRQAAQRNLAKGREFLAANAKRPGVQTRPSGLQFEVLEEGTGPAPGPDDVVVAHYRGTRIDGTEFDATDPAGEPARFPLRGVIPGWREALPLMKAGSRWKLWIPADLAYGPEGSPAIEPNEVLVFEITLVRSEPAKAAGGR